MELKEVFKAVELEHEGSSTLNPFNGIESLSTNQYCSFLSVIWNPFNGIESRQGRSRSPKATV